MLTTFSSAMSTPSSIVGEQNRTGSVASRNSSSRCSPLVGGTWAVCSRASMPLPVRRRRPGRSRRRTGSCGRRRRAAMGTRIGSWIRHACRRRRRQRIADGRELVAGHAVVVGWSSTTGRRARRRRSASSRSRMTGLGVVERQLPADSRGSVFAPPQELAEAAARRHVEVAAVFARCPPARLRDRAIAACIELLVLVDRPRLDEALARPLLELLLPVRSQVVDPDRQLAPHEIEQDRRERLRRRSGVAVGERRMACPAQTSSAAQSSSSDA